MKLKRSLILLATGLICFYQGYSQGVAINSNNANADNSAMLDISSINKGVLIPRMTVTDRNAIASPATGLLIYQTNSNPGFYYNAGTTTTPQWTKVGGTDYWGMSGNAGTVAGSNFIGTTDNVPLYFKVNNTNSGSIVPTLSNTSFGYNALLNPSQGHNTAFGQNALNGNTTGTRNTSVGSASMQNNTIGYENIAIGTYSLLSNQASSTNIAIGNNALYIQSYNPGFAYHSENVAVGHNALYSNQPTSITNGNRNTAIGTNTLRTNTIGGNSTAVGYGALRFNTTGLDNTAIGSNALQNNSTGEENNALGFSALQLNTSASNNIAIGNYALYMQSYNPGYSWPSHNIAMGSEALLLNQPTSVSNGNMNIAIGSFALRNNGTGYHNTAMGFNALYNNASGWANVAVGNYSQNGSLDGSSNTSIGYNSLVNNTRGSRNTALGVNALALQNYTPGTTFNSDNVAVGLSALYNNQPTSTSNGINNTAVGTFALLNNTIGYSNTATGFQSAYNTNTGFFNTSMGAYSMVANASGSWNTAVGYNTGPNVNNISNTTCIGTDATATATDMVRIGNSFVNSIGGQVGWTTLSDGRFKDNVDENVPGLSCIKQLRPVTYRIDREALNEFTGVTARHNELRSHQPGMEFYSGEKYSMVTTGFIAQEVEAAAENLGFSFSGVDAPKNENDMYGLRYADFVVPLVKGMQEQQTQIEELKAANAMLMEKLANLEKELSVR